MARTEVTPETATSSGLDVTYTAAIADGHKVRYDNKTVLIFRNSHASTELTVTLQIPRTIDGQAVTDKTITVPATETRFVRGLSDDYRQSDGMVYVDYSATTTVYIAVVD